MCSPQFILTQTQHPKSAGSCWIPTERHNAPARRRVLRGSRDFGSLRWNLNWCGDRRTVVGRAGTVLAGLESGGFFDLPLRISIKNQLVMAFGGIEAEIGEDPVRAAPSCFKCYVGYDRNAPQRPSVEGRIRAREVIPERQLSTNCGRAPEAAFGQKPTLIQDNCSQVV